MLGFLRSCPGRTQSHPTSRMVHGQGHRRRGAVMTRSGPSFKSVDVCARSRPLPLACRSSLLADSTLSTTVLPDIDGHHSVTFTSTRGNARLGRRQSERLSD